MTWKTAIGIIVGALLVGGIDELVGGLSHAAVLLLCTVVLVVVMITTTPDAGGLRDPRED